MEYRFFRKKSFTDKYITGLSEFDFPNFSVKYPNKYTPDITNKQNGEYYINIADNSYGDGTAIYINLINASSMSTALQEINKIKDEMKYTFDQALLDYYGRGFCFNPISTDFKLETIGSKKVNSYFKAEKCTFNDGKTEDVQQSTIVYEIAKDNYIIVSGTSRDINKQIVTSITKL